MKRLAGECMHPTALWPLNRLKPAKMAFFCWREIVSAAWLVWVDAFFVFGGVARTVFQFAKQNAVTPKVLNAAVALMYERTGIAQIEGTSRAPPPPPSDSLSDGCSL